MSGFDYYRFYRYRGVNYNWIKGYEDNAVKRIVYMGKRRALLLDFGWVELRFYSYFFMVFW